VSKNRIKKSQVSASARIQPTKTNPSKGVSFSYKYFQHNHSDFTIANQDVKYLMAFLERLKDLSTLGSLEIKQDRSSALRCHPIDWTGTSQSCFGIADEDQLVEKPYQFSISSNRHGRVHGFFIEEIFYVVWLDPDHKLYPSK
jgi:hypothetical protein